VSIKVAIRTAMHDAGELKVLLFDLEAQPRSSRPNRIEFDSRAIAGMIGFQAFSRNPP